MIPCNLDLLMRVIFYFIILRFIAMRRIILCLKCKTVRLANLLAFSRNYMKFSKTDVYVIVTQTLTEPMQNRRIWDKRKLELMKVLLGS